MFHLNVSKSFKTTEMLTIMATKQRRSTKISFHSVTQSTSTHGFHVLGCEVSRCNNAERDISRLTRSCNEYLRRVAYVPSATRDKNH